MQKSHSGWPRTGRFPIFSVGWYDSEVIFTETRILDPDSGGPKEEFAGSFLKKIFPGGPY